jgi:hypothetical protein
VRKGLLILCYNANEPNWEYVVWGTPDKPGRLVRGVTLILEEDIDVAVIMSSAFGKDGKSSGQLMKELLYARIEKLREFSIYPILSEVSAEEIYTILERTLRVVNEPVRNTSEELIAAGRYFTKAGIEKVFLVTSPDHISRTIRDAIVAWQKECPQLAANVYGAPSVSLYSLRTEKDINIAKVENVIIAEPPVMQFFDLRRMFVILKRPEALAEIDAILKKYEK